MKMLFVSALMAAWVGMAYSPAPVVFDTPAENDRGSMILGDGEVGALAWISADGTLHTVLQRSDSWTEIGEHVKVGRIDYVSSRPVDAGTYRQELSLERGEFSATWNSGGKPVAVRYRLQWEGGNLAVCEIEGAPAAVAKDVNWRLYPDGFRKTNAFELRRTINYGYLGHVTVNHEFIISADRLLADLPAGMNGWYHENLKSTVDKLMGIYDYTQATGDLGKPDLLHDRVFGAITRSEKGGDKTLFLSAVTCFWPCKSASEWRTRTLDLLAKQGWNLAEEPVRRDAHIAGWRRFWDHSHIEVSPVNRQVERQLVALPHNAKLPIAFGVDCHGGTRFSGTCAAVKLALDGKTVFDGVPRPGDQLVAKPAVKNALRFAGTFTPKKVNGNERLIDNITPGGSDGFLVDILGGRLRVILGSDIYYHPAKLAAGRETKVEVEVSPYGEVTAVVNGDRQVLAAERSITPEAACRAANMAWACQRYITRCAAKGNLAMRFTGSLFTTSENGNPDHRNWGHGYWWQNVRLLYYPLFTAGDCEMTDSLFKMYSYDLFDFHAKRTRRYLSHGGAYFPECMQPWGDHFIGCYGEEAFKDRKDNLQHHFCHKYEWVGQLELSLMMIYRYLYTEDVDWFKAKALPAIREYVRYFDEHYKLAGNGRYDWQPAQALETWQDCTSPMPEVAGLTRITELLLSLPKDVVGDADRALFGAIHSRIPPLPTRKLDDGRIAYAQAAKWGRHSNVEHPELYSVFPFRLCSFEKSNLELGRNAYAVHSPRHFRGWAQEELFAAYLGMGEEAKVHFVDRVTKIKEPGFRWPAYWRPNFDWRPDQCHGGNVQNIIQSMLLQFEGRKIFIAPAWTKDWNCSFKLHAPYRTTIEGRIENGQVKDLVVTPASRRADIVIGL